MAMTAQTNIWLCSVEMSVLASQPMVCTFRARAPWGEAPADVAQDVANAWMDDASFASLMSSDLTIDQVTVGKVEAVFLGHVFSGTIAPNTSGLVEQKIVAPQVSLVVTKRSGIGGRKGRGRLYVPGLTGLSAAADNLTWSSSEFTTIDTAVQQFFALMNNGSVTTGLTLPNGTSSDPIEVTELAHQPYFGTQRRRAGASA